jgi:hypothetical protein
VPGVQRQQGQVSADALDDGADGGVGGLRAHDQVAFVVAGHQPALDLGRPLADRHRVDDPDAERAAAAAAADRAPGPQAGCQFPAQLTAGIDVDGLVDRLVADPHRRVAGILHRQPPADLLGRVPPVQHLLHHVAQRRVLRQPGRLGPPLPLPGQPVRPLRLVAASPRVSVTGQLPADRRRAAAQPRRDLPHRQPALTQPGQLIPLLAIQVTVTVSHSRRPVHPAHPAVQEAGVALRHAGHRRRMRRPQPACQLVQHQPHLLRREPPPTLTSAHNAPPSQRRCDNPLSAARRIRTARTRVRGQHRLRGSRRPIYPICG